MSMARTPQQIASDLRNSAAQAIPNKVAGMSLMIEAAEALDPATSTPASPATTGQPILFNQETGQPVTDEAPVVDPDGTPATVNFAVPIHALTATAPHAVTH